MALTLTQVEGALNTSYDAKGIRKLARLLLSIASSIHGIPTGGTTGQALEKNSNTDYDASWQTVTTPPNPKRGIAFGYGRNAGIATGKLKGYFTCPYAGNITGWAIQIADTDSGTVSIRFWQIAAGTAVPTVANNINSSPLTLSTGTHIESTALGSFTGTAVTAGDIFAVEITAFTGSISDFSGSLEIQPI